MNILERNVTDTFMRLNESLKVCLMNKIVFKTTRRVSMEKFWYNIIVADKYSMNTKYIGNLHECLLLEVRIGELMRAKKTFYVNHFEDERCVLIEKYVDGKRVY